MADEYISREEFKAEALRLSTHYLNEWDTLGVLAAADRIPSADVQPVRHGRWIETTQPMGLDDVTCAECSECGEDFVLDEWGMDDMKNLMHYCPNCGCRMDLEDNDGR